MSSYRQREVVVEFEHTRVVRRRTKTRVRNCPSCESPADFAGLIKLASLFAVSPTELFTFVQANTCHFIVESDGEIHICLAHLLKAMNGRPGAGTVKLLGDHV